MRPQMVFLFSGIIATTAVLYAPPTSGAQHPPAHVQAIGDPLDINTATPQQLKALPGFGDAYVKRVIAGRPYTAKNQLLTRGVIPQAAYASISPFIVAHRPAK